MPTFIDESGDHPRVADGGKPYFRLAAAWFPTIQDAESFRETIRNLRSSLGLRSDYEFKFHLTHAHPARRVAFYTAALRHPFRFSVCSIDKTAPDWNDVERTDLFGACATCLSVNLRPMYHQAESAKGLPLREPVVVDDNSDKVFLQRIRIAFRGLRSKMNPGSSLVSKVKFDESGPEPCLHLADMVCGAVSAMLDQEDRDWYRLIAERSIGIDEITAVSNSKSRSG